MADIKSRSTTSSYSFKSVGETFEDYASRQGTAVEKAIPLGIKTPLSFDTNGRNIFEMHFSPAELIKDNLRNLILTNKGERLGNPRFGAGLRQIQFGVGNPEEVDRRMMSLIKSAVKTYMPYVNLADFSTSEIADPVTGTKMQKIRITFTVPLINQNEHGLVLFLPIGG